MSNQEKRVTVGAEELAYSNMMTLNALVELLEEKGVVAKREVFGQDRATSKASEKTELSI